MTVLTKSLVGFAISIIVFLLAYASYKEDWDSPLVFIFGFTGMAICIFSLIMFIVA